MNWSSNNFLSISDLTIIVEEYFQDDTSDSISVNEGHG